MTATLTMEAARELAARIDSPAVTPEELQALGAQLADEMLCAAVQGDRVTRKAARGGVHAKHEPRAWSYGGMVD